jgi:hypothetical protein
MRVSGAPAHTVIAFSYLLIIFYALTLAPICWVYAAEVWSLETRATGMGISAIGNWLFSKSPWNSEYKRASADFCQTSPSVSSSRPHSSTSDGDFSLCSEHCVLQVLFNSGSRTQRHVARLLKRSKSCSILVDHRHGRRRRASHVFMMRWLQSPQPKPRRRLMLSSRRLSILTEAYITRRSLRLFECSAWCGTLCRRSYARFRKEQTYTERDILRFHT